MESSSPAALHADQVLQQALVIMQPLILWLLRSGVRHPEFSAAMKQVFLDQARHELDRLGGKQNDSAISMLSGLHRKDVKALLESLATQERKPTEVTREQLGRPTVPSQVITRWMTLEWPEVLPFAGEAPSFEAVTRQVSNDVHPRAILNELIRLGMVTDEQEQVRLCRDAFIMDPQSVEAGNLFAGSCADHLAAGVHNLSLPGPRKFLEQSVFADGLSQESIKVLERLALSLWSKTLQTMLRAATPLSDQDEPQGGDQRIRLGMFCYSEPIQIDSVPVKKRKPRKAAPPL